MIECLVNSGVAKDAAKVTVSYWVITLSQCFMHKIVGNHEGNIIVLLELPRKWHLVHGLTIWNRLQANVSVMEHNLDAKWISYK